MSRGIQTFLHKTKRCTLGISMIAYLCTWNSAAQDKDSEETIDTERLVIVKAYTPTISDAFKMKATPQLSDSLVQPKKDIRYSIFSVPVASTYTPIKGKAASIDKPKRIPLYDNYATLGVGNFTSVLAEFYSNFQLNRSDNIGLYLHHNSSQGGIKDVVLDDKFYNTDLAVNYTSRTRDFTYGVALDAEHKLYNWYGLPEVPTLSETEIASIDPQQNYIGVRVGSKFEFDDWFVKNAAVSYRYFADSEKSTEHRFLLAPTLDFEIGDERITTKVGVDFLSGGFESQQKAFKIDYQFLNLSVAPSLLVLRDALSLTLGAQLVYSLDNENSDANIYIYPAITASYRLLDEVVIAYGALEGGLQQQTYRDAVQQNPFVAPTILLQPTHQQLDAYIGLKGKLSDVVSYDIRGGYTTENDKPLFVNNRPQTVQLEGYDYGNSFIYRYDDVATLTGYGALNFNINKKFKMGVAATYYNYSTDTESEAWNLPEIKADISADYQINAQWFAGAQLFYVGERKDIDTTVAFAGNTPEPVTVLDSYFDANLNVGYRFSEQLSVFVKGNNLAGQNYERWVNFPVQGIQVLGGVTYKFNY